MRHFLFMLISLFAFSTPILAEDNYDDFDLESYFSIKQKSTLDDFPLQEIGSEELSNAAIAGALQANSSGDDLDAKPVYQEQKEKTDKKKVSSKGKDKDQLEAERLLRFSQQTPTQTYEAPKFITPSIRELTINSHTIERD